jgi:hypothetical protein
LWDVVIFWSIKVTVIFHLAVSKERILNSANAAATKYGNKISARESVKYKARYLNSIDNDVILVPITTIEDIIISRVNFSFIC